MINKTEKPYHNKGVANPHAAPSLRAVRDCERLAVDGYNIGWRLTHHTPERVQT